ncbi:hypothetical protein PRUPE_1G044900 [Prunus persica]|uniref:Exopolygalacturonase-like n=1 Tax=Prunus persica TaxID=3760 RepID=A0A251QSL9_PRUPE|nr:hypothetical protein PRUPE_1G044900 [Prunus persica]
MAHKLNSMAMILFLLLASTAKAEPGVFDVTTATYGVKPGPDITQALAKAWNDACASPSASIVVVLSGTYKLREASFKGPCKAPIEIRVQGILHAPTDGSRPTKKDTWVGFEHVNMLSLSGGGTFDGQGALSWSKNDCNKNKNCKSNAINLRFNITNSTVQDIITSLNSKNVHMNVFGCKNVTFQHVNITAPGESVNTDGIHIGHSTAINITDANIGTGDDCVSIGHGSKEITVTKVTCGPGHGISIGSLGKYLNEEPVVGIRVNNCTLRNTQNGLRIKTWPASPSASTASAIHFEDIIMVNVGNPVLIDQKYCPWNQCKKKFHRELRSAILYVAVAYHVADIDLTYNGKKGPLTFQCSNVKPTITRVTKALACATSAGLKK